MNDRDPSLKSTSHFAAKIFSDANFCCPVVGGSKVGNRLASLATKADYGSTQRQGVQLDLVPEGQRLL